MEITIERLSPELAEDYVRFFDQTPHDTCIDENKCYCVTWRGDASYKENPNHWFATREERRSRALQYVKNGSLKGYLAFLHDEVDGDRIVGWCNANAECQLCVDYLRSFWQIADYSPSVKVKSVFCFTVAPDVHRTGVATRLLEHVCSDAEEEGYDFVEAYVNRNFIYDEHDFRGPLEMYKKCGFYEYSERDGRVVVRKALNIKAKPYKHE